MHLGNHILLLASFLASKASVSAAPESFYRVSDHDDSIEVVETLVEVNETDFEQLEADFESLVPVPDQDKFEPYIPVPDVNEAEFEVDTDGDGFSDGFERMHYSDMNDYCSFPIVFNETADRVHPPSEDFLTGDCNGDGFSNEDAFAKAREIKESVCAFEHEKKCDYVVHDQVLGDCTAHHSGLDKMEIWQAQRGFWIGEYTFLGADGNPYESASWPYDYQHYRGFIHLDLVDCDNKGGCTGLDQRNVFLYPSLEPGLNGSEKIFQATQSAVDCKGNLAGPYEQGGFVLPTKTEIINDNSMLYTVKYPAAFGGAINQNQLTTIISDSVNGNHLKVRGAQGFTPTGQPQYSSFYREYKVDYDEWVATICETRKQYSIPESDYCGFDQSNQPSGKTCEEHFGFPISCSE